MMSPTPRSPDADRASWQSILDGFRFLRKKPVLQGTYIVDYIAMVFGMPRALFPELAVERFGGDLGLVGLLNAAVGVGALVGAVFGGWFGRVRRQGLAVLVAVAAWGLAIVGFGFATSLWLPLKLPHPKAWS